MPIRTNLLELQSLLNSGSKTTVIATQDWNFALTKTLTSNNGVAFTHSRASGGGYTSSNGLYRWSGVNYLPYSEDYSNAWWTKGLNTILSDFALAPDGVSYADKVVPTAANGYHNLLRTAGLGWNGTFSVYLKDAGYGFAGVEIVDNTVAVINLSTGAVVSNTLAGSTISTENVGNGWWRVSYTYSSSARVVIYPLPTSTWAQFTGDGTSGILVWGMLINTGGATVAGHYVPTGAAASTNDPRFDHRYVNGVLESFGILNEEQRINYATYTEDFSNAIWVKGGATVSANAIASPAGYWTADGLVETAATSTHYLRQDVGPFTAGQVVNFSAYIKAGTRSQVRLEFDNSGAFFAQLYYIDVDLTTKTVFNSVGPSFIAGSTTIEDVGGGWLRIGMAAAATSSATAKVGIFALSGGASTYLGVVGSPALYVWGANVEIGNERTSYIPNLASGTVTRSADVVTLTGAGFTGFWNATEGSVSIEFSSLGAASVGAAKRLFAFRDSGGTNSLNCELGTSTVNFETTPAGANLLASRNSGPLARDRWSARYKLNDFAGSFDGGAVYTDTTVTLPTGIDRLDIGNFNGGSIANCHIARLRYFNKALTDKQLEDLGKPELSKALDLQFASTKSLTPLVGPTPSYSRASNGWYFNASGVLTQAAIDVPRFDHTFDGANWISRGLLIEEQRTNLLTYSALTSGTGWTSTGTTTAAYGSSPLGPATSILFTATSTNAIFYNQPQTVDRVNTYCVSVYAKMGTGRYLAIRHQDAGGRGCNFDLQTGTVSFNGTGSTGSIQDVGGGWYRCCAAIATSGTTSVVARVDLIIADTASGTATTSGKSIELAGAQCEVGVAPSSLILTAGTSATRSADVCTITGANFSGMWNASETSVVAKYGRAIPVNTGASPFSLFGSSESTDLIYIYAPSGNESCRVYVGNTEQCGLVVGANPTAGSSVKTAFGIRANDFAANRNGGTVVTDASGTVTVCTQMKIGYANSNYINSWVESLTLYTIRLPNRLLVQKSS